MKSHNLDSGICMAGNGDAFARALDIAIESRPKSEFGPFYYCEIGLGSCETFRAAKQYLWDCFSLPAVRMIGVDSIKFDAVKFRIEFAGDDLYPFGSSHFLENYKGSLDFCFIDGCHCYDCAMSDFLGIEQKIVIGGVIALHDIGIPEQGIEPQYGDGPIAVRKACEDLRLIPCARPGWKLLEETTGDVEKGGRGCLFFQRV